MADEENKGYGQQGPSDNSSEYNALMFTINQRLARVRTMTIVKVIAVENDGGVAPVGFVDVQPIVKQLDGASNATPHGTIFNVPYTRIQGGKNAVIIDPAVDDIGWMAVADRDISAVKSTKAEAQPGSLRKFDLADGVYMGGILNGVPEQYVRFFGTGIELADKNNNKLTSGPTGWTFVGTVIINQNLQLGGAIQAVNGASTYAGNLRVSGTLTGDTDVVAAGKSIKAHTHPVTSAPGTTGPNN